MVKIISRNKKIARLFGIGRFGIDGRGTDRGSSDGNPRIVERFAVRSSGHGDSLDECHYLRDNAQQVIPLLRLVALSNLSATGGTNFGDGLELLLSCAVGSPQDHRTKEMETSFSL